MTQPIIFISYSHKDEKEKDKLLSHLGVLQREGLIGLWSDDRIGAGTDWKQEISEAMTQARVAILLISANFLNSNFILGKEVPPLLKRRESEGLTVFPVIAKACAWKEVEWLTEMNVRPKNGRPIWDGSRRVDKDLTAIAQEVAAIVKPSPPIPPTASGGYVKSQSADNNEKLTALYKKLSVQNLRLKNLFELLHLYQQNLHEFKMSAARTGTIHVPIDLHLEIEETQFKINELEKDILQVEGLIIEIKQEIEREERKQIINPLTHHFGNFLAWPAFNKYTEDAQKIFVAGGSLDNLIQLYGNFLVRKAETGCEVCLIFMDPESSAIPQVDLWSSPDLPQDYFRRAICRSLRYLAECDRGRKLKIRLDPSIPAMTVVIVDGDQPDGKVRVDLQPFQAVLIERPVFELTRHGENEKWYDMFYRQYSEKLWSIAKPVDLSNLPSECL